MKHPFQALPGLKGRGRPVLDIVVEGLELAPQACLLDTGASEIRMGRHVAGLAGIDLQETQGQEILVGGLRTIGQPASVALELRQGADSHTWHPTIYFCDPWPWAFGLLGLAGLDPFLISIDPYEEWVELQPVER